MSFLSRSRKPISPYDRLAPEKRYALYFLLEYLTRAVPLHQMSWALQYLEKAAKYFGMTKNQIEEFKLFFNSYDKIIGYVKSIQDREIYEYMISNCSNIFILMDGGEEHKRLGQQAYKLYEELGFSYSEVRTIVNKYMYRTDI